MRFARAAAFRRMLSSGYARRLLRSRIFLDRYYTDARDVRQTYDLVIPRGASGSAGLILCIHGGGWVEGGKDAYTPMLLRAGEEMGLSAACMNYRYVSDTVGFVDVLDDVTSALDAIRARGETCGVRFDRVLLTGISAGGHISLLCLYASGRCARAACLRGGTVRPDRL